MPRAFYARAVQLEHAGSAVGGPCDCAFRVRAVAIGLACLGLVLWAAARAESRPTSDPQALLRELDALSVDPSQIYLLRDVRLTRDRVSIYFNRGFVALLAPVDGVVTGALFEGSGEVLLIPPNAAEKQSLAEFTGSAVLEEQFNSVCLRFTDQTAQELLSHARRPDRDDPEQPVGFVERWNPTVLGLDRAQSVRILEDLLGRSDRPYFHAQIDGVNLGVFEVRVDERRPEAVSAGAVTVQRGVTYGDVWCSFPSAAQQRRGSEMVGSARALAYTIDTRINADNSLEGRAELELESRSSGDRVLTFELSRRLRVLDVEEGAGTDVLVLAHGPESAPLERENDLLSIVLSKALPRGQRFRLIFRYQGNVIANVGNGVLYVGAHGSWYPNASLGERATYDLTFHYPEHLTLVATGRCVARSAQGGIDESRWVSDGDFPVAGFNLGAYDSRTRQLPGVRVTVYATREAESALEKRYAVSLPAVVVTPRLPGQAVPAVVRRPLPPLDPAELVDRVAERAAGAVQYFATIFGSFPYARLAVAQIPGDFGQGWPELVYLPTLSFLSVPAPGDPAAEGGSQETENTVVVAHEIAHQWWGNLVGWKTYRDQWLSEGLASYAAALDIARGKQGQAKFDQLLRDYKRDLLSKTVGGATVESGGPIWLGARLNNSKDPGGYDAIVYKKACWVMQMLRMVMTDPARDSNERFFAMLREFVRTYRDQNPSTQDFARMAEKYMPPAADLDHDRRLDWFFQEWVYGTGIPTYSIEASTRAVAGHRFLVEGRIRQSGVSPQFEMLVPVAAWYGSRHGETHKVTLGRVAVSDSTGRFRFTTAARPSKVSIDADAILAVVR